ncbi:MAG: 4-hydroxy-tetrahydrodipicolinate synthase [Phycisphaerales bacterium]|nr:4-hydroxy-tetrahydrodipicolinate synthase [Phycisphaerales bacterium]
MTSHATHRRFRGAFTAIVTPFNQTGDGIDFGRLDQQIEHQARGGVTGIVIAGTTGESPTLTHHEYEHLVKASIERARVGGVMAIVGTGSNSTAHAVELQRLAAKLGADAALSVNPYYNKPGQEGLYRHFMTVADSADLPVMLYNIPGRTGVALTPATIEKLSKHPNIRAVKEATGSTDSCSEIAQRCPNLEVLSGDDSMTLPFAAVGAVGVVSVVSNLVPGRVSALCKAFLEDRWSDALTIHRELFNFCRVMFTETNPIPVKAAMKLLGRDSGVLRLPMTEGSPETLKAVQRALTEQSLL